MMPSRHGAAQYRAVRNHGLVADATPVRLVQIVHEQALEQLATAEGCMRRIRNNLPLADVAAKGAAMSRTVRLIGHLDATLDMERGGDVAVNLHNLYSYMLTQLTRANVLNDAGVVAEVAQLLRTLKIAWDRLVAEAR